MRKNNKSLTYLISFLMFVSLVSAYNMTVETIYTDSSGYAKTGTYTANYTLINSSGELIFENVSSVTLDSNGRFNRNFDLPYFGNSSLYANFDIGTESTGFYEVGYVPYSVNTQYFQGYCIGDFALLEGNNSFDSGTLFIDSGNDRIGVKTTSPETTMHIIGNISIVDGNVGIGTLTPNKELTVIGGINQTSGNVTINMHCLKSRHI